VFIVKYHFQNSLPLYTQFTATEGHFVLPHSLTHYLNIFLEHDYCTGQLYLTMLIQPSATLPAVLSVTLSGTEKNAIV